MNGRSCLIDTDILSYILKRKEPVYNNACKYLHSNKNFTISCITYYECLRGYKAVNALKRLQVFYEFLDITNILYLDHSVIEKASEIYGFLKQKGKITGEFDTLIGATAIVYNLTLITNNQKHYQSFEKYFSLKLGNWNIIE